MNASSKRNLSKTIRYIGVVEGISYLVLLVLSILKRTTNMDVQAGIKHLGMGHGVLFMLFVAAILLGKKYLNWDNKKSITAFIASLIPFGTFWLDIQLKKDEALITE